MWAGQGPVFMKVAHLTQCTVVNLPLIWGSFVTLRLGALYFLLPPPAFLNFMQATVFLCFHKSWSLRNEWTSNRTTTTIINSR